MTTSTNLSLETTKLFLPQFSPAVNRDGTPAPNLIQTILQDSPDGCPLYPPTMSEEALQLTLDTRRIHVYSRSDKVMRRKGATSGDELAVVDILVNCNQDALLFKVKRLGESGNCCHTHRRTCFYRILNCTVGKKTEYFLTPLYF